MVTTESSRSRLKESPELTELYKRVGDRIQEVRVSMGVSQREACTAVFGDAKLQGNWSRWERGATLPNLATLHQIAQWGGVSLGGLGLYEPKEEVSSGELARARELVEQLRALLAPGE